MLILNDVVYSQYRFPIQYSLKVNIGEKVAILGPSGSGKTTLLNLIGGFLNIDDGEIIFNGLNYNNMHPSKRSISMLFQKKNLFYHLNVFQNIAIGLNPKLKITKKEKEIIEKIIFKVKLEKYIYEFPEKLSEGQRQRVGLARCLIRKKSLLLLDEPFSFLDPELSINILKILNQICYENKTTLLIVLQNLQHAKKISKRAILIVEGKIFWDGLTEILIKDQIMKKIYD